MNTLVELLLFIAGYTTGCVIYFGIKLLIEAILDAIEKHHK